MNRTSAGLSHYISSISELTTSTKASRHDGTQLDCAEAIEWTGNKLAALPSSGGKLMMVGNGGSAAIASHMVIDFSKNGGVPALAFNDPASLTCLANDLGYENVFSHQIKMLGQSQDLLFAISSSGRSPNILNAVTEARAIGIGVLTFSGFEENNPLRSMGDMNLYLSSNVYGFVEIGHLTLCHAILDITMGWRPEKK